jgi:hypothetical protein
MNLNYARRACFAAGLFSILLLGACVSLPQAGTPFVGVYDQNVTGDTVTIDYVVSVGPGWIVIHVDNNGKPGEVIGHAAVSDGINKFVRVKIDTSKKTDRLIAMLHTDSGEIGTYEFPQGDPPVKIDDKIVMQSFATKEEPAYSMNGARSSMDTMY